MSAFKKFQNTIWAQRFLACDWLKAPALSAVESIQKILDGKSSKLRRGCIGKQKVGKIQLFGQKEAFYRGNDFAYPHCTSTSRIKPYFFLVFHQNMDKFWVAKSFYRIHDFELNPT